MGGCRDYINFFSFNLNIDQNIGKRMTQLLYRSVVSCYTPGHAQHVHGHLEQLEGQI